MSSVYSNDKASVVSDLSQQFTNKTYISQENKTSTDRLRSLINKIDDENLYNMMQIEFEHMLIDHQRLVKMLQQQSDLLQSENDEIKVIISDIQRRYEKAVREMQFFKKKYDRLVDLKNNNNSYNLTPSNSPQPVEYLHPENYPASPSSSDFASASSRRRNNSNTGNSVYSSLSSSTDSTFYSHKQYPISRNPSMVSSYSTPQSVISHVSSSSSSARSQTHSIIQQRKLDPLTFGGSDALWDTISKSQGSDITVEKIIRYKQSRYRKRGSCRLT